MQTFFSFVLVGALLLFIFYQVRGFIRDRKKRKELKKQSKENLKSAEQTESETYEQDDHS